MDYEYTKDDIDYSYYYDVQDESEGYAYDDDDDDWSEIIDLLESIFGFEDYEDEDEVYDSGYESDVDNL